MSLEILLEQSHGTSGWLMHGKPLSAEWGGDSSAASCEPMPVTGMEARLTKPWASALPSRPHPPRFPASGEWCEVLSVKGV